MNSKSNAASSAYAGINGYQNKDSYSNSDPYANKNDPYQKKQSPSNGQEAEKKSLWTLDFEILRFFRENYNAGIDFEETPRSFFDEEHMLGMRIKLMKRNFSTILTKLLVMFSFSFIALFLNTRMTLILGSIYFFVFLYYIAVPMGFVKYARRYVANDEEDGKLKKIHKIYASYIKPLETIAMKFLTICFILIQIAMLVYTDLLHSYLNQATQYIERFEKAKSYISSITISDMQNSILLVLLFYIFSYFFYMLFMYKFWEPKCEEVRKENEKAYRRTNQRTARNLRDELTKEVE